jgi:hypothetical protein
VAFSGFFLAAASIWLLGCGGTSSSAPGGSHAERTTTSTQRAASLTIAEARQEYVATMRLVEDALTAIGCESLRIEKRPTSLAEETKKENALFAHMADASQAALDRLGSVQWPPSVHYISTLRFLDLPLMVRTMRSGKGGLATTMSEVTTSDNLARDSLGLPHVDTPRFGAAISPSHCPPQ